MLAKAPIVRSSVLILPLPRIPTHRHPATRTTQAKNKVVIFFIGNMPPVIRMQRAFGLDSRKFCDFGKLLDYKACSHGAMLAAPKSRRRVTVSGGNGRQRLDRARVLQRLTRAQPS